MAANNFACTICSGIANHADTSQKTMCYSWAVSMLSTFEPFANFPSEGADANSEVAIAQRKKNMGLLAASLIGHDHCVEIFIREGAEVNCREWRFDISCRRTANENGLLSFDTDGWTGWTPLMYASGRGNFGPVQRLIKAGADVNLVIDNWNALLISATNGHYKCVETLIEAGANVNITDPAVTPPLICAVRTGDIENNRKIIDLLIKAGADVNITFSSESGMTTVLAEVVRHGTPQILSKLIEAGADVNLRSSHGTPLFTAAFYGKSEFISPLVEAGADVNLRNGNGETPLHGTLTFRPEKTLYNIIELGADVNVADNNGMTALMLAARFHSHVQDVVRTECLAAEIESVINAICRLLKAGAQIGRQDDLGRNSLQVSFHKCQENVQDVQMLLYAAGETLDGPTDFLVSGGVIHISIPQYFKQLKENLDLKHLCREAIRKHLIDVDPHENLFRRIPQLGLPSIVTEYLLYNCSLDSKRAAECENNTESQSEVRNDGALS